MPAARPNLTFDTAGFRERMPVARRIAYFDHAAVGPISGPAANALRAYAEDASTQGDLKWPHWQQGLERLREATAGLLGAHTSEIALIPNTTAGINWVAEGIRWQPGESVVVPASEFPSNIYPWLNLADRGVETRRVPVDAAERLDVARVLAACGPRTRLVAVSWVGFSTGFRAPLAELAEALQPRGIWLMVDGIQGLGVFPLDVRQVPIDFLVADGHKWLLGPEGAGVMYVKQDRLNDLRPLGVGWNSVRQRFDFHDLRLELREEAARYEGGSANVPGLLALEASMELLRRFGAGSSLLAERVLEVGHWVAEELGALGGVLISDRSPGHASGILAFDFPGHSAAHLRQVCLEHGVAVSCRGGRLRLSPHAYNDQHDVARLAAAVRRATGR